MDEKFVNEGRFSDEEEQVKEEKKTETFGEMVKRKWSETTTLQKVSIIGTGVLLVGGIFYCNGRKAGKIGFEKKLSKELAKYEKTGKPEALSKGSIVERAVFIGQKSGKHTANKEITDLLAKANGKGYDALNDALISVVKDVIDDEWVALTCLDAINETIDKDFTAEIEKAAGRMAVDALKNDAAMKDVVYEAAGKAAKRVVENGDLVEGIVKRTATATAEDFLSSKRFKKEVKELVSDSIGNLSDELTTTIEKVVDKYIEDNYAEI